MNKSNVLSTKQQWRKSTMASGTSDNVDGLKLLRDQRGDFVAYVSPLHINVIQNAPDLLRELETLLNEIDARGYHNDFSKQRTVVANAKGINHE